MYTSNTIQDYLKWYETLTPTNIASLYALCREAGVDPKTLLETFENVEGTFKKHGFKTCIMKQEEFGKDPLKVLQALSEAGIIHIYFSAEDDTVAIRPAFISPDEVQKVKKVKTVTTSKEATNLYLTFCEVQNKFIKLKPKTQTWIKVFDLMLKNDNLPYDEIDRVIKALPLMYKSNGFCWTKNILSPQKLRKHYNKLIVEADDIREQNKRFEKKAKDTGFNVKEL